MIAHMREVAHYDKGESQSYKIATTYNEFCYDNQTDGGAVAVFEQIRNKIKDLQTDVSDLSKTYKDLGTKYEKFTNFHDEVESIISRMNDSTTKLSNDIIELIRSADDNMNEVVTQDTQYVAELHELNGYLAKIDGEGGDSSGYTPGAKATTQKEKADVAERVILGTYGSGEERKKLLESQGYDYREIQDIVNKKMNNTYTPQPGVNPDLDYSNFDPSKPKTSGIDYSTDPRFTAKPGINPDTDYSNFDKSTQKVSGIDYSTDPRYTAPSNTTTARVSGIDYQTDPRFRSDIYDRADGAYASIVENQRAENDKRRASKPATATASTGTTAKVTGIDYSSDPRYTAPSSDTAGQRSSSQPSSGTSKFIIPTVPVPTKPTPNVDIKFPPFDDNGN